MTLFVCLCMLVIGFLSGIIATVGFVAYLETKPAPAKTPEPTDSDYMSKIDTPEGIEYHSRRN